MFDLLCHNKRRAMKKSTTICIIVKCRSPICLFSIRFVQFAKCNGLWERKQLPAFAEIFSRPINSEHMFLHSRATISWCKSDRVELIMQISQSSHSIIHAFRLLFKIITDSTAVLVVLWLSLQLTMSHCSVFKHECAVPLFSSFDLSIKREWSGINEDRVPYRIENECMSHARSITRRCLNVN